VRRDRTDVARRRSVCDAPGVSWPVAVPLWSPRLALEPLAVEHADEMASVLAHRDLYRFTGGGPPTLRELRVRYARQARGRSVDGSAGWLNWILRPTGDEQSAIGFVQATLTGEACSLTADLAWLVTPASQGHGFAVEAATAVSSWLRPFGVGRTRAFIRADHTASSRVARRIGLTPTTTFVDGEVLWEAEAAGSARDRATPR